MNKLEQLNNLLEQMNALNMHEVQYELERLKEYKRALFKYAKFKVGDTVSLVETPEINTKVAWGWIGYKDILIQGAKGIIEDVDWYKEDFRYGVLIGRQKGTFTFYEDKLELTDKIKICKECGSVRDEN